MTILVFKCEILIEFILFLFKYSFQFEDTRNSTKGFFLFSFIIVVGFMFLQFYIVTGFRNVYIFQLFNQCIRLAVFIRMYNWLNNQVVYFSFIFFLFIFILCISYYLSINRGIYLAVSNIYIFIFIYLCVAFHLLLIQKLIDFNSYLQNEIWKKKCTQKEVHLLDILCFEIRVQVLKFRVFFIVCFNFQIKMHIDRRSVTIVKFII